MSQTVIYNTTLTELTSSKLRFKCADVEHKAFDEIKQTVAHETLLAHPDLNKRFDIHVNTINFQMGAVISQEAKAIAFYSLKLARPQTRYTVTEQ